MKQRELELLLHFYATRGGTLEIDTATDVQALTGLINDGLVEAYEPSKDGVVRGITADGEALLEAILAAASILKKGVAVVADIGEFVEAIREMQGPPMRRTKS